MTLDRLAAAGCLAYLALVTIVAALILRGVW